MTHRSIKEWTEEAKSYQYLAEQRRLDPPQKTFGWVTVALLAFIGGTVLAITQITAVTPIPLIVGVSGGLILTGYYMLWIWWDRRRGQ